MLELGSQLPAFASRSEKEIGSKANIEDGMKSLLGRKESHSPAEMRDSLLFQNIFKASSTNLNQVGAASKKRGQKDVNRMKNSRSAMSKEHLRGGFIFASTPGLAANDDFDQD